MSDESLQAKQAPLDSAIWRELFAQDLPEDVCRIRLQIDRTEDGRYQHTLEALDESASDDWLPITPSDDLFEATRALVLMLRSNGAELANATYESWPRDDGKWKTTQSFAYLDDA